jgi:hypothetical protein
MANGQTPPPLTAGSAQAYGSDGNRTAQQALGQAADMTVTMLSQYSGPVLGLGFNAAMTLGSVINGDAAGVVQFGGQLAMNALEIAALVNPCGLAAKGLAAYGATVTGSQLFEPGGFTLQNFLLTGYNLMALFGACFTGDMLVDVEGGKKRADEVKVGDKLWSRNEFDPDGPLMLKEVEERFVRVTLVLNLGVAGQVLRTTGEHPFWVENRRRWLPARELKVGDLLRTRCGSLVPVESLEDPNNKVQTVYNWRIADYHTYFVSATASGVSVWAHNAFGYSEGMDAQVAEIQANKWHRVVGEFLTFEEAVAYVRGGGDVFARNKDLAYQIARAATGEPPVMHTRIRPGQLPHYHPSLGGQLLDPHVMW